LNIQLLSDFHISARTGCIMWIPVSGYHSDLCGMYSVR